MIYRIMRYVIALLFGVISYMAMDQALPVLEPYIEAHFLLGNGLGLTAIKVTILVVASILGALVGYFISTFIIEQGLLLAKRIERILTRVPNQELIAGTIGLLFGLIIANLIGVAFNQIPIVGPFVPVILSALFGYIGMTLMARKGPEMYVNYIKQSKEGTVKDTSKKGLSFRMFSTNKGDATNAQDTSKLLDTSVLIDGRIRELTATGFIDGPLVVPTFVLGELQIIADNADGLKRQRGRRGLDVVKEMQEEGYVSIVVVDIDYDDIHEVDSKLMRLALEKGWKLMTNDYNLNKVASVQGIKVLNLNELANALKPALMAGEWIDVEVMKEGKDVQQGVGYMEDGTMIVVEDGRPYVGQVVQAMVMSVLQTNAGRIIFTRVDGGKRDDN